MKKANKNGKRLFVAAVDVVLHLEKSAFARSKETYELIKALEAYADARDWREVLEIALKNRKE